MQLMDLICKPCQSSISPIDQVETCMNNETDEFLGKNKYTVTSKHVNEHMKKNI